MHLVRVRAYLRPNESLITAKSHRAAKLKLVSVSLAVDRNSWVVTFILTKGYKNTAERQVKSGPHMLKREKKNDDIQNSLTYPDILILENLYGHFLLITLTENMIY